MPEIFLDGEHVQFDGPAPSTMPALLGIIERSLAASRRVVAQMAVDGLPHDGSPEGVAFDRIQRVEITSLSMDEAIAQVVAACRQSAVGLRDVAAQLAGDVLTSPWSEVAPKLVSLGQEMAGLMQGLGSVGDNPDLGALARDFEAGLHHWMDTVAARDAGGVCLSLDGVIGPLLERIGSPGEDRPGAGGA